jgi:N-acetylglucosamine-6-phosphate deacetylase
MKTLLIHARVISPDVDYADAAVLLDGSRIGALFTPGEALPAAEQIIDLKGDYLLPGFFDIHSHGCAGHDFCDGGVDAVRAIARHKLSQGVSSFLGTTLTLPEEELAASLQAAKDYVDSDPDGARIPAIHLEGPFFTAEGAGAQNPAYLRAPDLDLVRRLHALYPIAKLSYSLELDPECRFVRELVDLGIMPSCAHSLADYELFKRSCFLGLKHMTHFCNVMTPLHHLHFGLVGGGLLHRDVFVELICDGVHLCPEMIELLFMVKGCDHIMLITDSMRAAGMPDGDYSLGGLPVLVRDGCARLKSGQVAGSTLLFHEGLKRAHALTSLPLSQLVKTCAWNQARSLNIADIGKIEAGFQADLVVLDQDLNPVQTWVGGQQRWRKDDKTRANA